MFTERTNQKDAKRMSKLLKQWNNVGVIRKSKMRCVKIELNILTNGWIFLQ